MEAVDIGGYRIDRLLGRGGQSDVFLAHDPVLERPVALKLLKPSVGDEESRARLLRESRLAAGLDHPNVIPIYEAGEADGILFIAMRYVDGTDLARILASEGVLSPARTLELLSPVAGALDASHARSIVHGDVKPSNILVAVDRDDGSEHVYLSDFGLSLRREDEPAGQRYAGSVGYSAPERILGEALTGRSDQYSLACVLFRCLTGIGLFDGPEMRVLWAHAEEPPPAASERNPSLPGAIDRVLGRALAKEPEERFESCRVLCAESRKALGLGRRRLTRRQFVAVGAVTCGAVAAGVGSWVTLRGSTLQSLLTLASDAVVRIDPETAMPTHAVRVEDASGPLVEGDGSLWLADKRNRRVLEIDPATARAARAFDIGPAGDLKHIAAGAGVVFVGADPSVNLGLGLRRLDLSAGRWSTVPTPVTVSAMTVHEGVLWTGCDAFLRIDVETGVVTARISPRTLDGADFAAATTAGLWFAGPTHGDVLASGKSQVFFVDAETTTLGARVEVGTTVVGMAAGAGAVWMVGLEDDLVRRIDPVGPTVSDAFRVGRVPNAIAATDDAVWVTSSRDGTITRYDVRTADVRTAEIGGVAQYLATVGGAVWAPVQVL